MEKVIRDVAEIDADDRRAIEHLLGAHLAEHQQVVISVIDREPARPDEPAASPSDGVPAPWRVYEGLSDADVDRLDRAVRRRADLTRAAE